METHFASVLSTNYVPSKDELGEIRNLLVDPLSQLNQIDSEIIQLHNVLDQLNLKRNKLHSDIVQHQNLISPLRRIPEEILQEIFFRCLPTDRNAAMSCHEAPLLLGRVCSQWRQVALSTHRLWSSIHITARRNLSPMFSRLDQSSDHQNLQLCERVEAWLGRSGSLPLSISIFEEIYPYPPPPDQNHMVPLLRVLMEFSARWKHVCLVVAHTFPELYFITPTTVPILESFFFHITNDFARPSTSFDITPWRVFEAPSLWTLSFFHPSTTPKGVNWSQLTSLYLESCEDGEGSFSLTPLGAIKVLRNSSNLINCELNFSRSSNNSPLDHMEAVTMPQLRTLRAWEGATLLGGFLALLRLPVLTDLELVVAPFHPNSSTEDALASSSSTRTFLSRLHTLKGFTLSSPNLEQDTLLSYLELVPSINRLSVLRLWPHLHPAYVRESAGSFEDVVASRLTPNRSQPILCPLLKVLECNPCNTSDAVLLDFIQQRTTHALAHSVQPLERVDVIFHRESTMNILCELSPSVRAQTNFNFDYLVPLPPLKHRIISPMAGLEKPNKLHIIRDVSRHFFH